MKNENPKSDVDLMLQSLKEKVLKEPISSDLPPIPLHINCNAMHQMPSILNQNGIQGNIPRMNEKLSMGVIDQMEMPNPIDMK